MMYCPFRTEKASEQTCIDLGDEMIIITTSNPLCKKRGCHFYKEDECDPEYGTCKKLN